MIHVGEKQQKSGLGISTKYLQNISQEISHGISKLTSVLDLYACWYLKCSRVFVKIDSKIFLPFHL